MRLLFRETVLLKEKCWPACICRGYGVWMAADPRFPRALTLIYCNRIPHCPRCTDYTLKFRLSRFCLITFVQDSFFVGLRCCDIISMLFSVMWLKTSPLTTIFTLSLYPNFILVSTSFVFLFFSRSSFILYVRGHLQGGSSLSSSVASSAARRVRQLPQLPSKSSTVEQGK